MKNAFKPLFAMLFALASSAHAADDALVTRGAYLARAGDCVACHSTQKGKPLAGGLPMMTPLALCPVVAAKLLCRPPYWR